LPGPYGSGDLGRAARRFLDFLAAARQRHWQMLPVGPVGYGSSPYSAESAFAGSPLLVDLDALADDGLVGRGLLDEASFPERRVDYGEVALFRERVLRAAFEGFSADGGLRGREFTRFAEEQAAWLDDFALYRAIKRAHGHAPWIAWDRDLRRRKRSALERARERLRADVDYERFVQLVFARQWATLREDAARRGIALLGDVPIFVAHDSADVWAHPELFHLDEDGAPTVVAGVPPDYFSATGQRWGNPLYRWKRMEKRGFDWWIDRIGSTLRRFDAIRLDHFIGFVRHWEIPADEPTAVRGRYVPGPGEALFQALRRRFGALPLVAEDLGVVTCEVKALRDRFELPGLRILQFAFGSDPCAPDFLPHNYPRRTVVYTGTHDNDTTVGWFTERGGGESTRTEADTERERRAALRYLGTSGEAIHWEMIRAAHASVANLAIVPLQDALGLGSEARMNRPGKASGNWEWRATDGELSDALAARLAEFTETYGRALPAAEPEATPEPDARETARS
jgi:4-alpha-glucanotransferase